MDYDFYTHENKTKWHVAPKRQRGAAAKHLVKPLTAQRCSHRLNHSTIEIKSLENMVCCRLIGIATRLNCLYRQREKSLRQVAVEAKFMDGNKLKTLFKK